MNVDDLLEEFKRGELSREDLKSRILAQGYSDIGVAKLDTHRCKRRGFPEVVYCRDKTGEQVERIFLEMSRHHARILGTKAWPEQFERLRAVLDVSFDPVSRLITRTAGDIERRGKVVVLSAGTSDLPIAEEAAQTAEFFGSRVVRHFDCGVAGIHRLLAVTGEFAGASAVVAVAGMDGALPTVASGLSACPVIAVPTSVGYGASFQGLAALLTMLNTCSPGVSVVNIDNGFGAGYLANLINLQTLPGKMG